MWSSAQWVNAVQRCSVESQKGIIAIDFVQQYNPSGFLTTLMPFWLSTDDII